MIKLIRKVTRNLKKIFCKHNGRIISFYPNQQDTFWENGKNGGHHSGVVFRGCLKCKRVWIEDYKE